MLTRVHKSPGFLPVDKGAQEDGTVTVGHFAGVPDISSAPVDLPSAWFIGPRAENADLMELLSQAALQHVRDYRHSYLPGDPQVITPKIKESPQYKDAVSQMTSSYHGLLRYLRERATPFFSLRYQAHMLWDNTLPALAGYFAGMLHNPNNVTIQASTSTTLLEMLVMRDLCHMVGWPTDDSKAPIPSWAHITADGSIANNEAVWSAREVKFLPFAIRAALLDPKQPLSPKAKALTVTLTDGTTLPLLSADEWQLFNIRRDEILSLPGRIAALSGLKPEEAYQVWGIVVGHDTNAVGLYGMSSVLSKVGGLPVVLTPSTRHYSWPKSTAVNGFGTAGCLTVMVDADARMRMDALKAALDNCLKNRIPVLMTVSVCGSTEESAVDPLTDILALREKYRAKGLEFDIHVDAAWGGYILSTVRKDFDWGGGDLTRPFISNTRNVPMSDYTIRQFEAMRQADSVTIDPHKSGYIQYPAGAVLYRNKECINLTTFTGAYIGAATDPTVGMFGLEGSKPGAAAAAVFFSHMCIRPSVSGYGRILSYALSNARQLYTRLLFIAGPKDRFICVPLARLPAERSGADVKAQREFIRSRILSLPTPTIQADPEAMALFRQLGPDQNIVDYGFNALVNGKPNTDPAVYNQLIQDVYDAFHVAYNKEGFAEDVHKYPLLLTMTTFTRSDYGDDFMDTFAKRLGLKGKPDTLNCLRSVVMDPYVSDTTVGSFFDTVISLLRDKVNELSAPARAKKPAASRSKATGTSRR
jgi:hypothetical protein